MQPTIGSLFSGYGGLDLAVEEFFGARTAWHCQYDPEDPHQYAAAILAHHYPGVPNHGDITAVDWAQVEPVDILTGGFPCTDLSLAGTRAGLNDQTRSGLWLHMARAIEALRPRLVVIENVRGLLSAPADRGLGPDAPSVDDATGGRLTLRALGAVLADVARLGFDAEWLGIPASAVGAPHERFREFILAWPADAQSPRLEVRWLPGRPASTGSAAADADQLGAHRPGTLRAGRPQPADSGLAAADSPADAEGDRRGEGRPEPARLSGGPDTPLGSAPDWGPYAAAVHRWEYVLGRPAPAPVDDRGRLHPAFVEWMMGLPAGWITGIPIPDGMTPSKTRNAQLKAGGNGVVPQQAYAALAELWYRATADTRATAAA